MGRKGKRGYEMEAQSYKDLMNLFLSVGEKEFRAIYTAQRDIVMKNLTRLAKSGGQKALAAQRLIARDEKGHVISKQAPAELRALDRQLRQSKAPPDVRMKTYVAALSHINTLYFQPTMSLTGWEGIYQRISTTLEEHGYRKLSKEELVKFGEIMEAARSIYGRKNVPSDTILEMVDSGFINELVKLAPEALEDVLKKWEKGQRDNATLFG